jgi:hypothetical protein
MAVALLFFAAWGATTGAGELVVLHASLRQTSAGWTGTHGSYCSGALFHRMDFMGLLDTRDITIRDTLNPQKRRKFETLRSSLPPP